HYHTLFRSCSSIAASHEFWITSLARRVARSLGAFTARTPGFLTGSFLKSLERSPDEPLCHGVVSSQVHPICVSDSIRPRGQQPNTRDRGQDASSTVSKNV